jgi:hypothetical protein
VSDRAGNSYVVLYGNGTYYSSAVGVPARIDYAPSSAGGTTYTSSIVLTYASRPVAQATVGYVNGTPVKNNNLLTNIQVNQYPQKSRSYRLTYEAGQATTRARLAQVQECAYFNDCCRRPQSRIRTARRVLQIPTPPSRLPWRARAR